MATTAPTKAHTGATRAGGAGRVDVAHRRLVLATACYVGMAVIVGLTILSARVLPPGLGVPAFFLAMVALVAVLHPAIRLTGRR